MSKISDALAAIGKLHFDEELQQFLGPSIGWEAWEAIDKSKLDSLAWIKEALPWLEKHREYLLLLSEIDKGGVNVYAERLVALDALIARAKPEEVGR